MYKATVPVSRIAVAGCVMVMSLLCAVPMRAEDAPWVTDRAEERKTAETRALVGAALTILWIGFYNMDVVNAQDETRYKNRALTSAYASLLYYNQPPNREGGLFIAYRHNERAKDFRKNHGLWETWKQVDGATALALFSATLYYSFRRITLSRSEDPPKAQVLFGASPRAVTMGICLQIE